MSLLVNVHSLRPGDREFLYAMLISVFYYIGKELLIFTKIGMN